MSLKDEAIRVLRMNGENDLSDETLNKHFGDLEKTIAQIRRLRDTGHIKAEDLEK